MVDTVGDTWNLNFSRQIVGRLCDSNYVLTDVYILFRTDDRIINVSSIEFSELFIGFPVILAILWVVISFPGP